MIIPFYGELTVWIRKADAAGWHFPTSGRKAGETILEVAKRELWDSARIVPPRLDLLGAIRYQTPKSTTAYAHAAGAASLGVRRGGARGRPSGSPHRASLGNE